MKCNIKGCGSLCINAQIIQFKIYEQLVIFIFYTYKSYHLCF